MKRIALLTCHSAGNAALAACTAQNKWDYSAKHGYDLITLRMDWEASKVGFLLAVRQFLTQFDIVMTLGSDVLFMNQEIALESLLLPGDNVVMARERLGPPDATPARLKELGWSTINNDVILWVNTKETRQFLQAIIDASKEWLPGPWLWQRWLADKIEEKREFTKCIRLVEPRVMNSTHQGHVSRYEPGDWIIHFVCYSNFDKLSLAREYLRSK